MFISISNAIGNSMSFLRYVLSLVNSFKQRVYNDAGVFEAEACLINQLQDIQDIDLLQYASLVVTPNAYKESKLYSVVPNTTLGDMNVVRATTATRVNSAGLIEVVPRNLLTYSNDFISGAWLKSGVTITANTTVAPNGTTTASKIVENGSLVEYGVYKSIPLGFRYSHSIYAKKGERDWIKVNAIHGANGSVWFNLANGTIGTNNSSGIPSIENIGNGWYRCVINNANHLSASSFFSVMPCTNNNVETYTGTAGNGIFIWGAQLEAFPTATEYFQTTTRLNIPRIDYTNGSCPSILVEPQRTNLLTYSEQFNDASWNVASTSTVTLNSGIAPNGSNTANLITATSVDGRRIKSLSLSAGTYTYSYFVKKGNQSSIQVLAFNSTLSAVAQSANFDLDNGTLTSGTGTIQQFTNGWYKVSVTFTILITNTILLYIKSGLANNAIGSTVYAWGAQLEAGSNATSYIPTVASTVTRNADVIPKTGISSLIGQTEGTIFVDANLNVNANERRLLTISNGTEVQRLFVWTLGTLLYASFNGVGINLGNFPIGTTKIAIGYTISGANTTYSINVNNNTLITGTAAAAPNPLSAINLGSNVAGGLTLNDRINSTILWKTRLSNTELAQLTTI